MLLQAIVDTLHTLPLPKDSFPTRHNPSIVTRTQVRKILPLLRNDEDKVAVIEAFLAFNGLTANEQIELRETLWARKMSFSGADDFLEVQLGDNGCTVIVSIYRMDDDAIYLRIDPDCSLVIREVAL